MISEKIHIYNAEQVMVTANNVLIKYLVNNKEIAIGGDVLDNKVILKRMLITCLSKSLNVNYGVVVVRDNLNNAPILDGVSDILYSDIESYLWHIGRDIVTKTSVDQIRIYLDVMVIGSNIHIHVVKELKDGF